ncbi:hypothetical protein J422_00621 [Methanocaldococcus villosus KIN24-T80]|uniref:Hydantoinase A/oxoprolinase domain-containing protein n=1 Tax=Methanocaldococcus villosus KIN24-T80 TaxID=1069083 RepID=N6UWJ9_9EURY|nr:(4-{4-[2-(gamma-L-glutamylamino)ethyl]phenoxymethyl}furan-2-yl)methanamine synthase [Methanocaldococcus villosus]ENN96704.1 hypothetical protein J422_00621 [Methanocaldococcus villosus KIN24-T80]
MLGIDIGGANTKIVDIDNNKVYHIYFPIWKMKDRLVDLLKDFSDDKVALVMTAELADCYKTKREGVEDILNKVGSVFKEVYVLDVDGNFLTLDEAKRNYLKVSASNWMASAKFISKFYDNCIFIDMGSTTTDIIPIKDKKILAKKTDLERLMENQLLYVGALRTNLSFLTNRVLFRGKETNISSEYFAITADICRILGKIDENDYSCETPDGGGKDLESCYIRLARVLCADIEMVSKDELYSLAEQFYNKILNLIRENVNKVASRYGIKDVVICGQGEDIIKDALKDYNVISIKEKYGKEISLAFPAFAVGKLLEVEIC